MYVIKDDSDGKIYPADRCVFESNYVAGADAADASRGGKVAGFYRISNAQFYPGNAAAVDIDTPIFGTMGKSGRFVPMTE